MGTLLNRIRDDLKQAILDKDDNTKNTLRIVLGEIPRLNKKAETDVTDKDMEGIIRKLIKSETLVLEMSGQDTGKSNYIELLDSYIPELMTEQEIVIWIKKTINLDDFNPKMKAMSTIMRSLKGKADGKLVKDILIKM